MWYDDSVLLLLQIGAIYIAVNPLKTAPHKQDGLFRFVNGSKTPCGVVFISARHHRYYAEKKDLVFMSKIAVVPFSELKQNKILGNLIDDVDLISSYFKSINNNEEPQSFGNLKIKSITLTGDSPFIVFEVEE